MPSLSALPMFGLRRRAGSGHGVTAFGVRLMIALAATMMAVGVVGYVLIAHQLRERQIAGYAAAQRADVASFEAVVRRPGAGPQSVGKINQLLDAISQRPGTLETRLIDPRSVVVKAGGNGLIGYRDSTAPIRAALARGRSYAGMESGVPRHQGDFEFVAPLTLRGGRYAFEVDYDQRFLAANLGDVRRSLLLVGLLALLGGTAVFYLAGGRMLMRSHRVALQRATRDGLTDLPNHRAFQDDFAYVVEASARSGQPLALIVFDIDDFKFLNDRHGHPHGDSVLLRVACVLRDGRTEDRAYRVGGDEFAMVLTQTDGEGARTIAARLTSGFAASETFVSMGIGELRPGQAAAELRAEADAALYEAKRRGGQQVVVFDEICNEIVVTTPARTSLVRDLIDGRRVTSVFQPIWDLQSQRVLGLEALMRPDPSSGLSSPAEAFDLAEKIGRVHDLDVVCVHSALRTVPELPHDALLFLNLSPHTLDMDSRGNDWLHDAVIAAGLAPHRVVIEITERFGARIDAVVTCLQQLRDKGFQIALDDVGTGNSGLEMLQKVNADFVKIDRSIVLGAATDRRARAVLMAMATFARQTGAYVIAEGVEDGETLEFLFELDNSERRSSRTIQGGQGYGLGRPAPGAPIGAMPARPSSPVRDAPARPPA